MNKFFYNTSLKTTLGCGVAIIFAMCMMLAKTEIVASHPQKPFKRVFTLVPLFHAGAVWVDMDGSNDEVRIPDDPALDGFSQATFNLWVKQDGYKDYAGLIGKYAPRTDARSYLIRTVKGSSVSVVLSPDGTTTQSYTSLADKRCGVRFSGKWTMLTLVVDNSRIRYYHNGRYCDSDISRTKIINSGTQPLRIGAGNSVFFDGSMDDVKIYRHALNPFQVLRLYEESEHGRGLGHSVTVLVYHRIDDNADSSDEVTPQAFEQQMDYLYRAGFRTVTTDDYYRWKQGTYAMPKKRVILFFDDGHESVYTKAYPVMKKYGFEGTVGIVTDYADGHVGSGYMDWQQLQTLKNAGWAMQSHGKNHVRMLSLSESDFRRQLSLSKARIKEKLGTTPNSFIFPYHNADAESTAICGEYYALCWTVGYKSTSPRYTYRSSPGKTYRGLSRITISNSTTFYQFRDILSRYRNINGEWKFDENTGTLTKDSTSNFNHGALLGGAKWQSG